MNILVISLAGIGDTLFATPLIHELRANFPAARLDALVLWPGARDLLEGNPHLNTVYQKNLLRAGKAEALRFLWHLRRQGYDLSLNTHPQSRVHYRAVARVINARVRISHQYDNACALDRLLVNRTLPQDYTRHAIENNLALLEAAGARRTLPRHEYEVFLTAAETQWAGDYLARHQWAGRTLLGVHVGSGGTKNLPLRRWPLDHYLALFQELRQSHPELGILLLGGPEEAQPHQRLAAQTCHEQVRVAQTGSLRQAAALLQRCAAFLSVDTALMHLAAAMKVPRLVVIETPTWNKPIEPYGHPFTLIPNPAVAGRNLDYYRYDGRGIRGSPAELLRCMSPATPRAAAAAPFGHPPQLQRRPLARTLPPVAPLPDPLRPAPGDSRRQCFQRQLGAAGPAHRRKLAQRHVPPARPKPRLLRGQQPRRRTRARPIPAFPQQRHLA
ncbi:MAG: Lipopolysaccharide core heptosyltransferase RfaQ [Verrucomicrobia bacterium ADurb.Bin063]|nr:MAG: Lipopolysaccharide core heptosyltransferase RfaQ [Verrucomicrobia bacterium ADurb.Bin063]